MRDNLSHLPVFFVPVPAKREAMTGFLFTDLANDALEDGRAFDGLAFGKFRDMLGREIELNAKDIETFISNTTTAIEATRSESGDLVGLPIDARDHDRGDAAGWIVGVARAGDLIRLIPKWTEIGRDLIGRGIRRFFSATVDVKNKVILGGTLTNWPATRNDKGEILLRPVELSGLYSVYSGGQAAVSERGDSMSETHVEEVQRTEPGGEAEQLEMFDPVEEQLAETLADVSDLADLADVRKAMIRQVKEAYRAEVRKLHDQTDEIVAEAVASLKRENHIAEFARAVVAGTNEVPRGLPVGQEEVETFLGGLTDDQRAAAESIFGRIVEKGLIEFGESGHSHELKGVTPLPPDVEEALEAGDFTMADLRNPALGLGDLSNYDLSKWQGGNR